MLVPHDASSPGIRGGFEELEVRGGVVGFIPGPTGRIPRRSPADGCRRLHPRAYGADLAHAAGDRPQEGFIPVPTGRISAGPSPGPPGRLHPPHTGRMAQISSGGFRARLHPRAYGADTTTVTGRRMQVASSPCTRGGSDGRPRLHRPLRFIPVHTGRISGPGWARSAGGLHPRAYGADLRNSKYAGESWASSPCIRGGSMPFGTANAGGSFIPGHTGRNRARATWTRCGTPHPRAYGADVSLLAHVDSRGASSPGIRGGYFLTC